MDVNKVLINSFSYIFIFLFCVSISGRALVGDIFATKAGYLEVAELNNLIIIFPQVAPTVMFPTNPMGCWDWWGYSSLYYATKSAPQMSGIRTMIDTVRSINRAIVASTGKML